MAEIIIEGNVPSITVDKTFLIDLFKTINSKNPQNIPVQTEIQIITEKETRTYTNLRDFTSARYMPKGIQAIVLSKEPKNEKDKEKIIAFELTIDAEHPGESYYELVGYDEGKLEVCKKEIESLLDQYKTWYWFLFKGAKPGEGNEEGTQGIFQWLYLIMPLSLAFLTYRLMNYFRPLENIQPNQTVAFVGFFVFLVLFNKFSKKFSPYLDFRMRTKKRSTFWNFLIGSIFVGIIGNLIWEIIKLIL